jgi:hypothetical protein
VRRLARQDVRLHRIPDERRLALEMAIDEQIEVRELERQWREAEEIAAIADGPLTTPDGVTEELGRLAQMKKSQPES